MRNGMAVGNALARQLIRRWPLERLMLGGNLLGLLCAAALLLLALTDRLSVPALLVLGASVGDGDLEVCLGLVVVRPEDESGA